MPFYSACMNTDEVPALGYYHQLPLPRQIHLPRNFLSQASAPLQSITDKTPQAHVVRLGKPMERPHLLLPRFCPLQRFPSHGEPLLRRVPPQSGIVAPSEFRTLSTLCSPHDLPGLFHPGPAHGVTPSRLCSLRWCRTPSRAPPPS